MNTTHMPSIEVIERWLKDEDCDVRSTGFHFFCTIEEARSY